MVLNKIIRIFRAPLLTVSRIHTTAVLPKRHIQDVKSANDRQRSMMVQRQMNQIRTAVIENGGNTNTESNLRLRTAIESAIKKGVLKTTIQMALKKLKENPDASQLQRHIFECRVYNKVFMIAVYYTVNWGLTKSLVGNAFRRHNAEIIKTTHLFDEKGYINGIVRSGVNTENMQDDCETDAIETGANEVYIEDVADRQVTFYCEPQVPYINGVRQQLEKLGYKIEESGISYEPHNLVAINVKEQLDYTKFREKLEAIDGFDELFDNIEDDE